MNLQGIGGKQRNFTSYQIKEKVDDAFDIASVTLSKEIHRTARKCLFCGKSMFINRATKKEWCEYCE